MATTREPLPFALLEAGGRGGKGGKGGAAGGAAGVDADGLAAEGPPNTAAAANAAMSVRPKADALPMDDSGALPSALWKVELLLPVPIAAAKSMAAEGVDDVGTADRGPACIGGRPPGALDDVAMLTCFEGRHEGLSMRQKATVLE